MKKRSMHVAGTGPFFGQRESARALSERLRQHITDAPWPMHTLVRRWRQTQNHRQELQLRALALAVLRNPETVAEHLSPVLTAVYSLQEE